MKLNECRDHYYGHSSSASNMMRQLSFAGLALIWFFRLSAQGVEQIPDDLKLPTVLLVLGLAFDLFQYLSATLMWGVFGRYMEDIKKVKLGEEFEAPAWINWPGNAFFVFKAISVLFAYLFLLSFLVSAVF